MLVIILLAGLVLWFFRLLILLDVSGGGDGPSFWFADFKIYYSTARLFIAGENIYQHAYVYPPLSILLIVPFAYLPVGKACLLFAVFSVLLLLSTIIIISRILHYYGIRLSKTELLLVFIAVFLFYPVSITFTLGQINVVVLFLITLFYYYLFVRRSGMVAATFLGFATIVKVWPLVLAVLNFIAQKAKGLIPRYLLVFVVLCLISVAVFGISTNVDFLHRLFNWQDVPSLQTPEKVLHPMTAHDDDLSPFNSIFKLLSIVGVSNPYLYQGLFWGLRLILPGIALFYLCRIRVREKSFPDHDWDILTFASLIILVLIVSDPLWVHYGSFLVLPCILLVFVVRLNMVEKGLLLGFVGLFSLQQYVLALVDMMGGVVKSAVYIASPAAYAFLLFLSIIFYMIHRRKLEFQSTNCPATVATKAYFF